MPPDAAGVPVAAPPGLMPAPLSAQIAITGRCNLRCRYCFYADEMTALSDLPTERWLAFFAELGGLAVQRVTLTGGEAFTRPDLFELIDGIIENRMRYSILTNGTLVTEDVVRRLQIGKRRVRLDAIQVSVDGSIERIHNRSRPESFDRALRGLRLLVDNGFPVSARVTVNRHNIDDLEGVARLLLDDVGLHSFSTNEAFPMGAGKCPGESVVLTVIERQRAMATLLRLNDRYGGRIGAQAGPLAIARALADIEDRMAQGESGMPGRGTLSSCGGVFNKLDIQHDGTIVPCHLLPTFALGKIGEVDLLDVWLNHPLLAEVRRRQSVPLASLATCAGCSYAGFCTGGCPGTALAHSGVLNSRDPKSCYKILLGKDSPNDV